MAREDTACHSTHRNKHYKYQLVNTNWTFEGCGTTFAMYNLYESKQTSKWMLSVCKYSIKIHDLRGGQT
jgi:hypothetical protein